MTVNAHCEMPMPASRDEMAIPRDVAKAISDAYRHKESVMDFPFFSFSMFCRIPPTFYDIGVDPTKQIDNVSYTVDEYRIDLREVKGVESRHAPALPEGREFFLIRDKKPTHLVDWGLRPWDGTLKIQRSEEHSTLSRNDLLKIESFLPKTRTDLTKWARAHWGKRGDAVEFMKEMPQCLDYEKLKPNLPRMIPLERIHESFDVVLPPRTFGQYRRAIKVVENSQSHLISALQLASNPCDRFCEMLSEAPNAFWAERN